MKALIFVSVLAASFAALGDTLRPIYSDDVVLESVFAPVIAYKQTSSVKIADTASYNYNNFYVPNYRKFNIISGSMHPTVPVGSSVMVDESINFDSIKPGDIIVYKSKTFKKGTNYIVHRVIRKNDAVLICQGDRNPVPDKELVNRKNLVGKVVHISRNLMSSL